MESLSIVESGLWVLEGDYVVTAARASSLVIPSASFGRFNSPHSSLINVSKKGVDPGVFKVQLSFEL